MYYGLIQSDDIRRGAIKVCDVLGHGKNNVASLFLREIAVQETLAGSLRDRHDTKLGVGLMQIDRICFDDVKARTKKSIWEKIENELGIEGENVTHEMLAYSPLLALLWARLFLRLIPEEFPVDQEGRARYWKKYYNTSAGKGTVDEYLDKMDKYEF